jgi:hypothetical protein
MQIEPLPDYWQNDYAKLSSQLDNLPSATLICGEECSGVSAVADNLIAALLCQNPTPENQACMVCQSCQLLSQNANPDIFDFATELELIESKVITVDLVRKMINFAYLSPSFAAYKVVYIANMSKLNHSSANSLLKIIEEPPSYVKFIFVSYNLSSIIPTILSRCNKVMLTPPITKTVPESEESTFWQSYYYQQPSAANPLTVEQLQLLTNTLIKPSVANIFSCCEVFNGKQVSFLLAIEFVYKWLTDLVAYINSGKLLIFNQYQQSIDGLVNRIKLENIFYLSDELVFLIKWANHPLNHKLQLENILLKYQQLFSVKGN